MGRILAEVNGVAGVIIAPMGSAVVVPAALKVLCAWLRSGTLTFGVLCRAALSRYVPWFLSTTPGSSSAARRPQPGSRHHELKES